MTTITYRLAELANITLNLGWTGENETKTFIIDCKKVFDDYPNATAALRVYPPQGNAYPATVTKDGDNVVWVIKDSDLVYSGKGEIQLTFTEGGKVKKSVRAKTQTDESIPAGGTAPDPVQDWIDDAERALKCFPTGGTTGQVLAKKSFLDYDTEWVDLQGGGGARVNYVTPEDFGAAGDGTEDDTEAVQAAIDYATANDLCVRGYKTYKTTGTLVIDTSHLDVYLYQVSYGGTSHCISIRGTYNNFRFDMLYCSNGKGILMTRNSSRYCFYNKISGMRLYAKGNAVEFDADSYFIIYNTFDIRMIKSDTGDCYHGATNAGENVFLNSSCTCENGWAIYRCNGRFYNFTLEADVLNGIYVEGGMCYFAGFRIREMVDKLVGRISGTFPDARGGTLIKYANNHNLCSKFVSEDFVPYEAIDVSEAYTPEQALEEYQEAGTSEKSTIRQRMCRLAYYQEIDAPIRVGNWDTPNGYTTPGKKMIIQGGRKICIPHCEVKYTITDADYDMREEEFADNNAKIFPTEMVIGVDSCVIHLSSSYCPAGYSEFIVDQTQHTCIIYDSNDDETPIFNGAALGTGMYRLKAQCDPLNNVLHTADPTVTKAFFDGTNYGWSVEKIDGNGGMEGLNYVTPEDFGAVGDGITDDSEAIQDACDSGYNVYFGSDKTYYIGTEIQIDHDIHLFGGENTVIKTKTPSGGVANSAFVISGTLKKTTVMTSDYTQSGNTDNVGDRFELEDMDGIKAGDIMVITAEDQYYSYTRDYYYLGGTLLISDVTDEYVFSCDALPFDIENTDDVSVKIYSAPEVTMEGLKFISDHDSAGNYVYAVVLQHCKNATITNCSVTDADNGVRFIQCVNSMVDNVTVINMPLRGTGRALDHYGIAIYSCTNTTVKRIMGNAANSCIDMSGTIPNINTRILNSNLFALSRHDGMGMHENAYNTTFEDCVFGGLLAFGTVSVNRCRFVTSYRNPGQTSGISFRGSHNANHGRLIVTNCIFDNKSSIQIPTPYTQDNPQAFDHVIGEVTVRDCKGGYFVYTPTTTQYVLSNTIENLTLENWRDCNEVYHTSAGIIENMVVKNCEFKQKRWLNDHSNNFSNAGIKCLRVINDCEQKDEIFVNINKFGGTFKLPENVPISFTAANQADRFIVCGKNIASNDPADYGIGIVNGWTGDSISFSPDGTFSGALTANANGELVLTQPNNQNVASVYPLYMVYVPKNKIIKMSCVLKNTGATTGATFSPYIAVVSCATGKVTYRNNHGYVQATAQGATATHDRGMDEDSLVLFFLHCGTPVANSETTISNYMAIITDYVHNSSTAFEKYKGSSRADTGTLLSVEGTNNIFSSATAFGARFGTELNE